MNTAANTSETPLVSLAIFFYRQEGYVAQAVAGALSQSYGRLEIILSDDGSPDGTFAEIEKAVQDYDGPHRIRLNRNPKNLGLAEHVNKVMGMCSGDIICVGAGDDISLPDRVSDTVAAFARFPDAAAVSFVDQRIDEQGKRLTSSDKAPTAAEASMQNISLSMFLSEGGQAQSRLKLSGASRAIRRTVFDNFGPLRPDCPAEDTPLLLRALYLGTIVRCDWPGILYRIHANQLSTPQSIATMDWTIFREQYAHDLRIAQAKKLGKDADFGNAKKYFKDQETLAMLRKFVAKKLKPTPGLLLRVLSARDYSLREKAGLFKRFICRQVLR